VLLGTLIGVLPGIGPVATIAMLLPTTYALQPISALIRSADRIGQGDYTRQLDIVRRDELGDLQQALERMRGKLRQSTINKNYLTSVLNSMTDAVFVTSPGTPQTRARYVTV